MSGESKFTNGNATTAGVTIRRFSHESNLLKLGDTVRCIDGMRFNGRTGDVVEFVHDGKHHPVIVHMRRQNGEPGKRRVTFYQWEKISLDFSQDNNKL